MTTTTRTLLLDLQLFLADSFSKQNLLSTRNAYNNASGSMLRETLGLAASMGSPLTLPILTGNAITICRSASPVTLTYTPSGGSSTSILISDVFVMSHSLTAVNVQNANASVVDFFYLQM